MLAILAIGLVAITLPGTLALLFWTIGGLFPARRLPITDKAVPLAVIVPAHNESASIATTVRHLQACESPRAPWRLIVIADNCTDDTAEQARRAGAEVWERTDEQLRGKGYALAMAFTRLAHEAAQQAVLVVDADTVVDRQFLVISEQAFASGADAVQCRYTVNQPERSMRSRLMNVALMAFNVLRMRGRAFWGSSVGIAGNGWGVTMTTLQTVPYTARSVVEDLEYHLALVRAGKRVIFLAETAVYGDMPTGGHGAKTQRARWEGGRFRMMREFIPTLIYAVIRDKQHALLEPLLELLLLPLAWHTMLLLILLLLPFSFAFYYALFALLLVAFHVLAGIMVGGGNWRDVLILALVPFYILWKLALLPRVLQTARKKAAWIRTERG
ncbi:hypothetical protein TPSD3_12010 [Thioflexithrix psekupsensis]|uniref:Glycosyl transferase family 2 n=2 Tax=Thioflexithrix psekupsensis TaxID=1570016 RepID=A0A251X803_9GAMM|nr:hypothetical protein TPSD3_12010 [Thioflexithrix psekupsensis]